MDWLSNALPEMIEEGRRILLFSQFTSMLALIEEQMQELGIPYLLLTGDTRDRMPLIEKFQSGAVPLFLISLKAGGTGLNLTAADTVIHYDPWWNPAAEAQGYRSRASYRPAQARVRVQADRARHGRRTHRAAAGTETSAGQPALHRKERRTVAAGCDRSRNVVRSMIKIDPGLQKQVDDQLLEQARVHGTGAVARHRAA